MVSWQEKAERRAKIVGKRTQENLPKTNKWKRLQMIETYRDQTKARNSGAGKTPTDYQIHKNTDNNKTLPKIGIPNSMKIKNIKPKPIETENKYYQLNYLKHVTRRQTREVSICRKKIESPKPMTNLK